jgi:hypothetical protein
MQLRKTRIIITVLGAGALLGGCAVSQRGMVLDPVGPAPAFSRTQGTTRGTLKVYSAFQTNADFNKRDPYRREYSNYAVYSPAGKLLQVVHNDSGLMAGSPARVELPAGRYRVVARANGYGTVTVPVLIESGRVTTIHLEGGSWPDESAFEKTNAVCLPDGQFAGWRAAG